MNSNRILSWFRQPYLKRWCKSSIITTRYHTLLYVRQSVRSINYQGPFFLSVFLESFKSFFKTWYNRGLNFSLTESKKWQRLAQKWITRIFFTNYKIQLKGIFIWRFLQLALKQSPSSGNKCCRTLKILKICPKLKGLLKFLATITVEYLS